jgi:hypothetical protein
LAKEVIVKADHMLNKPNNAGWCVDVLGDEIGKVLGDALGV